MMVYNSLEAWHTGTLYVDNYVDDYVSYEPNHSPRHGSEVHATGLGSG